ncbi:tyrosine-type recombinase/integrase [Rouxiella badensis]|uniref:tyrosine-type recombinase/integrase n=1 Tax=Rouxiella badensis TaxID=1646377 RepID=UPI001D155572|nr:tyrosine-type recombinase/integrase [Rouxiella badensis]MCC3733677.1 tyrosine-type recombinase/integrase [Rouxiella badensis]MCC3759669.1 tyrosine-type recombinase/integrase [Rouxiella badensis]
MLTDTKLKNLKPREKLYKVSDREGLYVAVLVTGAVSFRYDYRLHGRRETLTIGKYGPDGISLAEAREKLYAAKKMVEAGVSPAVEKRDGITQLKEAKSLEDYTARWLADAQFADSTRAMKQACINRDIIPVLGKRRMHEITPQVLRAHCEKIKDRGARATAVQVREIVGAVFRYAIDRGHDLLNPAEKIKASSIATFTPRDRALSPQEIGVFFRALDNIGTMPTLKMAIKIVLLTMVRKSELTHATWDEVDFAEKKWVIPAARMKGSRSHVIYLSDQAMDIMTGLKMCAGGSVFIMPGRYDTTKPLSNAALNRVITVTVEQVVSDGFDLEQFSVHDLRRTASTLLHEAGFNTDWIEKSLAHEQRGVRAVYNKAEYAEQRRDMLQKWADMVDGWIEKEKG